MPTLTLDPIQFSLLVTTLLTIGSVFGYRYARRHTIGEYEARMAAAVDDAADRAFTAGIRAARYMGTPGVMRGRRKLEVVQ